MCYRTVNTAKNASFQFCTEVSGAESSMISEKYFIGHGPHQSLNKHFVEHGPHQPMEKYFTRLASYRACGDTCNLK